jgi:hypothetical protein
MSSPGGPQQPPNEQFGQQGGYPPPGGAQPGFPPPGPGQQGPPPRPARSGSPKRTLITLAVLAVLVIAAIGAGIYFNRDAASSAKVGDCMKQEGANELTVVKCDDAAAEFKVVGRVEDKSQSEATASACDAFATAEQVYWEGKQGEKGLVLCLAANS